MSLAIKAARITSQGSGRVRPGVGDPGFFGFLGKGLRTITGIASKVLPGPLGMIAPCNKLYSRPRAHRPGASS
jgi:hypothetical protein